MKLIILYASLFAYAGTLHGTEHNYSELQKNAIEFDNQCATIQKLVNEKVTTNNEFTKHMYNNLLMRVCYLQNALYTEIEKSFLSTHYKRSGNNESINKLCIHLVDYYTQYLNEHPIEEDDKKHIVKQWEWLLQVMNTIIVSHLFLPKNIAY
ncbi:hypothetical protein EKK58_01740 [Candidatus Dependentiae bacterium]|nr:MAG: hypothetical protein EKK58_01740 [Candidatus Dependentiae bacterium]